jgi:RNA polymerase sigma-70 factor (ECF subfamily)
LALMVGVVMYAATSSKTTSPGALPSNARRRGATKVSRETERCGVRASSVFRRRPRRRRSEAQEQLRWVTEAISELDAMDQQVCELCLVEGCPYTEAAVVLGISVGAIKQRILRSRARLRKAMVENEG